MTPENLIEQAKRIIQISSSDAGSALIEAKEFLSVYIGKENSFLSHLETVNPGASPSHAYEQVNKALSAFIRYVENGLQEDISIQRKAEIDVVSDFLGQAHFLLDNPKVHPAAGITLAGAAIEEFLRNWVEEKKIDISGKKPGINTYAAALISNNLITKQDIKDITSWAGLRNHAAHGEWEEVENKTRAKLMVEGIDLFIRKYT